MRKAADVSASRSSTPELPETSFARCLVDGTPTAGSRGRRRAFGLSFAIEIAALGLVILAPLMTSVALPRPVKSDHVPFIVGLRGRPGVRPGSPGPTTRPVIGGFPIFTGLRPSHPTPSVPDESGGGDIDVAGGSLIGDPSGLGTPGFLQPLNPVKPPPADPKKNSERQPLKLSEGVVEARLISRVEPRYPPLALQIRLQGTVRLQAIISRDGRITSLEVVSGHPLLVQSALDAVRQWRYHPTMLDGEPVEVETTISVVFQLHP
jgi:protein TonB